jgi:hypothetical protein
MRRALRLALVCLTALGAAVPSRAERWESIESLPGRKAETVNVAGKPRAYFRLTPRAPLTVTIAGPAGLKVISRAVLAGRGDQHVAYRIVALEGRQPLAAVDHEAAASPEARTRGVAALGRSQHMVVRVPEGTHAIRLELDGSPAVLVRLQRTAPAEAWVSLTPVRAARNVAVIEGQQSIEYYSALRGRPVVLRVVGPTTLDLMTRLDFDATMRGTQSYRLSLDERGQALREVEFHTARATTASYANLPEHVPSRFDHLSLEVGAVLHEIEVRLVTPATGAAEVHARIPQPAVGNTE